MIARLAQHPDEADLGDDHGRDIVSDALRFVALSNLRRDWQPAAQSLWGFSN
jgi:hypothetical protein